MIYTLSLHDALPISWVGHLRAYPGNLQGCAARESGLALSRATPTRAAGVDYLRVGRLGAWATGAVLLHHVHRAQTASRGVRAMGPIFGSGRTRDALRLMTRASLWSRVGALVRRDRAESELSEELQFHLEMQARKHRAAGFSEADAMSRARIEFGNLELVKEDARDVRGVRPLEDFIADVRYGVRGLLRAPVFSLSVILTIGLGVGLNTSVFTIFNAYVLRPFDIQDPYSLYSLQWLDRSGHVREFSPADIAGWKLPSSVVSDVASYRTFSARLGMAPATGD